MLSPVYSFDLVAASVVVSLMATFTGLTLTNGISRLQAGPMKTRIAMAAMALGGGIWSMHFVAMLAMHFPLPIGYDALYTLGSALIAILMAGVALLIMHFGQRNWTNTVLAGAILGNGIVAMHYVGMSAIRGCLTIFQPTGLMLSILLATLMGIAAVRISYGRRTTGRIMAGSAVFGISVVLVHYIAVAWTSFELAGTLPSVTPMIENGILALIVALSAFVICGTFLLSTTTYLASRQMQDRTPVEIIAQTDDEPVAPASAFVEPIRLPYERAHQTQFVSSDQVVAIQAEGHYTILYTANDRLFCPWSISQAASRLPAQSFVRTHRSYLVNMRRVSGFKRQRDKGSCLFDNVASLKAAPVSRGCVPVVKEALGI